ncbi:STAS domain-containing protein [Streptomyces sp. NPDC095817]|uniref:STAS domain-containing protein n=1 Tax=Streptomyces sp. NPDC095817 TaxID=3155082 RepID=UPI00332C7AF6
MTDIHHPAEQPVRLSVVETVTDGIRVLAVAGELDYDSAEQFREVLLTDGDDTPHMLLDFGAVSFMDSSAISVLVHARRHADAAGGWIRMAALTEPVQRVIEIVGLHMIVDCFPTLAEALTGPP